MIPQYFHVVIADLQPYEYEIERLKDLALFIGEFVTNNETGHLAIEFQRYKGMAFGYTGKLEENWPDFTVTFQSDDERTGSATFDKVLIKSVIGSLWALSVDSPFDTVYLKIDGFGKPGVTKWFTGSVNRADLFTITEPEKWN